MKLEGRVAVITGGASGLGWAAAQHLACAKRMKVALLDLPSSDGAALAAGLGADAASFHAVDVGDERQVAATLSEVLRRWGALHVCLNAAGTSGTTRILGDDGQPCGTEAFARTVAVNLVGSFNVMSHCAAAFAANPADGPDGERGVIVNVSSIAASEGTIGMVAYAASKAGIVGMMLPAARELARSGIRVLTIAPGMFRTPMARGTSAEVLESMTASLIYPRRYGAPEEFASLVAFLCENAYFNAEVVRIDGGTRLVGR